MNSDIFILARLGSRRLPEKHLINIHGYPIIKYLIARLKTSKKIRNIIVCTTDLKDDDVFVNYLKKEKILFFRGSEKDVLSRLLDAAKYFKTDIIIDVEGDKFYTDPFFVDKIINEMENTDIDFITGNDSHDKFNPEHSIHGFIPAGIKTEILQKICQLKKTCNTETGYKEFFTNNNFVKKKYIVLENNIRIPKNLRLSIDYKEDIHLANEVLVELGNDFHIEDVLELFNRKPHLIKITESAYKRWKKYYEKNITDFSLK